MFKHDILTVEHAGFVYRKLIAADDVDLKIYRTSDLAGPWEQDPNDFTLIDIYEDSAFRYTRVFYNEPMADATGPMFFRLRGNIIPEE